MGNTTTAAAWRQGWRIRFYLSDGRVRDTRNDAIEEMAAAAKSLGALHTHALITATRYGARFVHVMPGAGAFQPPEPGDIIHLGDDAAPIDAGRGPDGFHRASLEAALEAADVVAMCACQPLLEIYRAAAGAAIDGSRVVFVETTMKMEVPWFNYTSRWKNNDRWFIAGMVKAEGRA